jgi:ankyrin repeat protein
MGRLCKIILLLFLCAPVAYILVLLLVLTLVWIGFKFPTDKRLGKESLLCSLIRNSESAKVGEYLHQGENPNGYCDYEYGGNYYISKTIASRSLLTTALYAKKYQIAELLVSAGADVNIGFSNESQSPLYIAVRQENLAIVKLLIDKGANVNGIPYSVPLQAALNANRQDLFNLLLEAGADPNIEADATRRKLFHALMEKDYPLFKDAADSLIAKGADMNIRDQHGNTPLHHTVIQSQWQSGIQKAEFLLAHGADINAKNSSGVTTLHEALSANLKYAPSLARLLIAKGADINLKDNFGCTVLHRLVTGAHSETLSLMELVMARGVDVNATDKYGLTPLDYLARDSYLNAEEKAALLVAYGAHTTPDQ